jgi:hypothetical protein
MTRTISAMRPWHRVDVAVVVADVVGDVVAVIGRRDVTVVDGVVLAVVACDVADVIVGGHRSSSGVENIQR